MNQLTKSVFFPNLDGWRFIAFFAVFFHHVFIPETLVKNNAGPFFDFLFALKQNGALGVNLFFVLSGFLITYLLTKEKDVYKRINIPFFYLRRILRIWPLYYSIVLIGFFLFPVVKSLLHQNVHETATLPYYTFFISNFELINKGFADSIILNVLWSVGIEEQFYIVWPIILMLIPRKYFSATMFVFLAGTLFFRFLHIDKPKVLYYNSLSVCSDMLIGGLAAYYSFYHPKFMHWIQTLSRKWIVFVYIIGTTVILFNYKIFIVPELIIGERLIYALFFVFILLEQCFAQNSFYKISKFKLVSKWGGYTYGLYCLHIVAIILTHLVAERLFKIHSYFALMLIDFSAGLSLAMLLAYMSYRWLEAPFLKIKNKFAYFTK